MPSIDNLRGGPEFEPKSGGFQILCSYPSVRLMCAPYLSIAHLLGKATMVMGKVNSVFSWQVSLLVQVAFPWVFGVCTMPTGSVQKRGFPFTHVPSSIVWSTICFPTLGLSWNVFFPYSHVHVMSSGISTYGFIFQPLEASLPHTTAACRVGTVLILQFWTHIQCTKN